MVLEIALDIFPFFHLPFAPNNPRTHLRVRERGFDYA
jgi:hypothetical protein